VQLVEDEEAQASTVADDPAVDLVLPGHQQLEHHEVGEQDVRRSVCDLLSLLAILLPCVARDADRPLTAYVREELVELLELTVGQRVHRIDDDRAGPSLAAGRSPGEHSVDDRNEEAE